MKWIIAIIQPHRLEAVKQCLTEVEVFRLVDLLNRSAVLCVELRDVDEDVVVDSTLCWSCPVAYRYSSSVRN